MKKFLKILKVLLLFAILIIICSSFNVSASSIQIDNSTSLNYYVDLRSDYLYGTTLIQDGIINTTCNYLDNSYGCGIQVPLTSTFPIIKDRTYTISILLSTENKAVQPSTWRQNIVLNNQNEITSGGNRVGIYLLWALDTSSSSVYNADVNISLQSQETNFSIYKIDYTFVAKRNDSIKMVTFAYGLNLNGTTTTGTLRFSYLMFDASNQDVVDAVNSLKSDLSDINSSIISEETPSFNQDQFLGYLPENPISAIMNMPINIMNCLIDILDVNTCSPLVLPLPFVGGNITLPCVSSQLKKIGVWNLFDSMCIIICAFWLYKYFIFLYNWVDQTLTLRENTWAGYD